MQLNFTFVLLLQLALYMLSQHANDLKPKIHNYLRQLQ